MRHKKAAIAVAIFGFAAGGTAFGATQVDAPNPLGDVAVIDGGRPAELSPDQRERLTTPDTADYKLDLSDARVAADATGEGSLASLGGTWLLVPGAEGLCLLTGDGSMLCAPIEELEQGRFAMTTVPTAGQPYVKGQLPSVLRGAGKVQGVVPDGITQVVGLDKAGRQIGSTSVSNNVYELDIAMFSDLADVQVLHENGSVMATLPLGWNR
jgi:hypothetical protein